MFYDERIELERGRISLRCMQIAVVTAMIMGILRTANVLYNAPSLTYLLRLAPELITFLVGGGLLLYGAIRHRAQAEERQIADAAAYYRRAAVWLLHTVLWTTAILLPFSMQLRTLHHFSAGEVFLEAPFTNLLAVLFFLLIAYCAYAFKRKEIYFNYSILEREDYWRQVLKNVGKLGLYALCLLGASVCQCLLVIAWKQVEGTVGAARLLTLLGAYLGIYLELSGLYLLLSLLEHQSACRNRGLSRATVGCFLAMVLLQGGSCFVRIDIQAGRDAVTRATQLQAALRNGILLAFFLFLTYFWYEYRKSLPTRLLGVGCAVVLWGKTLYFLLGQGNLLIQGLFINHLTPGTSAYLLYSDALTLSADLAWLSTLTGIALILIALIRGKAVGRWQICGVLGLAAVFGTELFFRTQTALLHRYRLDTQTVHEGLVLLVLCYLGIVLWLLARRSCRTAS